MTQQHEPVGWIDNPNHHEWLAVQTRALLDFYRRGCPDRDAGGFWWISASGRPDRPQGKQLWINARMTYAFAVGSLLGQPGCTPLVLHGIDYLRSGPLRDPENGGWYWSLGDDDRPADDSKQAYGHAFVLLAAAAASTAGIDADDLFVDAQELLERRFWEKDAGRYADRWSTDFATLEDYRGQNANMHLVEALMLSAEATGDARHLDNAVSIAERLIRDITAANSWLLPEHFDAEWNVLLDYGLDDAADLFRPYGSTVGHWLEWSRLLLQLHEQVGDRTPWIPQAAQALFARAVDLGWDSEIGGFVFSTDWEGVPRDRDRYHWVVAEAIGAAVALYRATGEQTYDTWYRRFWDFAVDHLIDPDGSWVHQLTTDNQPSSDAWDGKPDLYHALQATLFARVPAGGSLITQLASGRTGGRG